MPEFKRKIVKTIKDRINEPRRFIQIVTGPRQTGKTTAVTQALLDINLPFHVNELYSQSCYSSSFRY